MLPATFGDENGTLPLFCSFCLPRVGVAQAALNAGTLILGRLLKPYLRPTVLLSDGPKPRIWNVLLTFP
jgi:hypothetical protein